VREHNKINTEKDKTIKNTTKQIAISQYFFFAEEKANGDASFPTYHHHHHHQE
jgi:hypothetical protein